MTTFTVDHEIDARAVHGSGPLMWLVEVLEEGRVGDVFELLCSDRGSNADIPAWVRKAGHELIEAAEEQRGSRFVIRKTR